jgi:hypothetical protein
MFLLSHLKILWEFLGLCIKRSNLPEDQHNGREDYFLQHCNLRFPTAREDEKIAPVTNVPGRSSISDLKEGGANSGGIFEIRP